MTTDRSSPGWLRSPMRWLLLAIAGAVLCALAYWMAPRSFLQAHLTAVVLWTSVSIGALMLLMIHSLVGGNWGTLLRPSLVSAIQPFWLLAIAFVPIALHLKTLYPWTHWQQATTPEHLWAKASYLDESMFYLRAVAYWALWIVGAWISTRAFTARVRQQPAWTARWHAIGLPLLVVSVTFAAVDWWMSLEPEWSSSAYGVLILAGQGAAALALSIIVASNTAAPPLHEPQEAPPHEGHAPISPWRDAGNLLLASICLWMYVSYSQFLIIWSGNLPEEATWYLARGYGPWKWVAITLVLLRFVLPFMLLLSRNVKEQPRRLALVAALVFGTHFLEGLWLVAPSFESPNWRTVLFHLLAFASVGAAWFFLFVQRFQREAALAVE